MKASQNKRLLGRLPFVSRTFEGHFEESPFVLDMDANLYIGPADQISRDEHSSIEVVYQFLRDSGKVQNSLRELLRDRLLLLNAFSTFDQARRAGVSEEFQIFIFGTYDGEPLEVHADDELPAGPCGKPVNELKRRLYELCRKVDPEFNERELNETQRSAEATFAL